MKTDYYKGQRTVEAEQRDRDLNAMIAHLYMLQRSLEPNFKAPKDCGPCGKQKGS